ncbi:MULTISPECIES: polyphosphate--glucose phosphotransferase [Maribacter]|uniref:Polyphosphate glucokinase n=1 Tax=Maribacter dokdonensis TaxID=320912 RepID=A0A1H4NTM7_9FLAO|nr:MULTISPECIES: ROK family protein [Maribacter]HAF78186.1 ROK family protein [Maribacter sp.]KSA14799.1 Polyphosphate glucokinase [Maribacter dokdonensis DSW-8]MBU2899900.1 ROK family protein [Maribacter dokdonensis]CAG2531805.1 polyphosphate glucokinase [Maribacter dokdonensis]SEB98581.1 polyphosphate glucokinase [Maribacter dokdonensis]|tara:strand:- start:109547 stop:110296 length:750 start_codon:yes stop_codon:yes gene_type:complete
MTLLGIDVGGSGIKGALVNSETGEMISERFRIPTPIPRTPEAMSDVIAQIVAHFDYKGKVGCGFPTIIKNGICKATGNLDKSWLGVNVEELLEKKTGLDFTVINDADAAGYATMNYGTGKGEKGFVVMITIGTGLGSGAFLDGRLIPNFELGQIPYKKYSKIEKWAAGSAKDREGLSYKKWGKRFNKFLEYVELIVSPDLIILGGGASKDFKEFKSKIKIETRVIPAELQNHAGIIGAAVASQYKAQKV